MFSSKEVTAAFTTIGTRLMAWHVADCNSQFCLPAFQGPRYIGWMGEKNTFVVTVIEDVGGRLGRRVVLRTTKEDEAVELYNMLKSDPEARVLYDVLPPGKVE